MPSECRPVPIEHHPQQPRGASSDPSDPVIVWRTIPTDRLAGDDLRGVGKLIQARDHKPWVTTRSEEHTSELQSLMRSSYAVFCLNKKKYQTRRRRRNSYTANSNHRKTT